MSSSYHPTADIQSESIGHDTRIWQFCVVLPNAVIGSDCNICSHCFIENDVRVGDRVTIKCGVQLWDGLRIEDDVFVGPNVTFANDAFPRSQARPEAFLKTTVKSGASIGANATILPGLTIGNDAMVGAGSVVTKNVPDGAIVMGSPARMVRSATAERWVNRDAATDRSDSNPTSEPDLGHGWFSLPTIPDDRGNLLVAQWSNGLPFVPKRLFVVTRVPNATPRGGHAHHECEQLLFALAGSLKVSLDNGRERADVTLDSNGQALYVPIGMWATQYSHSADCVLAVLASHDYDEDDYIRNYDHFKDLKTDGSLSRS